MNRFQCQKRCSRYLAVRKDGCPESPTVERYKANLVVLKNHTADRLSDIGSFAGFRIVADFLGQLGRCALDPKYLLNSIVEAT